MTTLTRPELATGQPVGDLEVVATFDGPMPTGVTVSRSGRIFVNFPKWGDDVAFTVGEVVDGAARAYPDETINGEDGDQSDRFVSVQSVVIDPADRLWVLDTASPMFRPVSFGGPKLVRVDLDSDRVAQTILFPESVALPSTYLNDVRFDLRRGAAGMAFITDSSETGPNGLIVVDLATGESWRRLHEHPSTKAQPHAEMLPVVEGRPFMKRKPDGSTEPVRMGADGIAIGHDGQRLYYCPLASRRLWSVSVDALVDRTLDDEAVAATIADEGDRGGGADGLESDAAGNLYATSYEHDAILRRSPGGGWETIARDPRLLWPDTMSVAADGYLYVNANQLHRQPDYQGGEDLRQKPYVMFRLRTGQQPVRLD